MSPADESPREGATGPGDANYRAVLEALLKTYQPFLEEELRRAKSPEELDKETSQSFDCAEEIALADRLFDSFLTDKTAERLLGAEGVKELGAITEWPWCWQLIRCCLKFGWLVQRAVTFRAAAYYLNQYWRCVRSFHGLDLEREMTAAERADLEKLTEIFAKVYEPFLETQLKSLGSSKDIADAVIAGKINCEEGVAEADRIFDQFLTVEAEMALHGQEAFSRLSQDRRFWFCRCWCLCSIKFGYCLARARSLRDVVRCLRAYIRCLRDCFRPLACELTAPKECVAEEVNTTLPALVVAVKGTAAGAGFSHYILEWSRDSVTWHATDFRYPPIPPGPTTQGNLPVVGGLLAYFDTSAHDAGLYFIRMTVHSVQGGTRVCTTQFSLFKQDVRILGIDAYTNLDTTAFDPAARFVEVVPALCSRPSGTFEVSFGECISVWGSAFVGGCEDRKIKRYLIDYKPGFETNPTSSGWTNFWSVDYNTVWQYRDMNMRKDTSVLTAAWDPDCVIPVPFPPYCLLNEPQARLDPSCWQTHTSTCQLSGLITLRLVVEDTLGNFYYDTQRVWIDNKPICAMIRIDAVPKCADIHLSEFAKPPDCSVPWSLPVSGIAYDEYIDNTLPLTRPNDNFDFYYVTVAKQGGSEVQIPIPGPTVMTPCFYGTSRVGNPGTSCVSCDPTNPDPSAVFGTLATFDLRAVDPICSASVGYPVPSNFLLPRGECCVYIFKVHVQDRTMFSGGPHWREALWPVRICNDLK